MLYDDVVMGNVESLLQSANSNLIIASESYDSSELDGTGLVSEARSVIDTVEGELAKAESALNGLETEINTSTLSLDALNSQESDDTTINTSGEVGIQLTEEMRSELESTLNNLGNLTSIQREKVMENPEALGDLMAICYNQQLIGELETEVNNFRLNCASAEIPAVSNPNQGLEKHQKETYNSLQQTLSDRCAEILGITLPDGVTFTLEDITGIIGSLKQKNYAYTCEIKLCTYNYLDDITIEETLSTCSLKNIKQDENGIYSLEGIDIEGLVVEPVLFFLANSRYDLFNYLEIIQYMQSYQIDEGEVSHLVILNMMWNDQNFHEYYKETYGKELTKEELVNFYGGPDSSSNQSASLQLRSFLIMDDEEYSKYCYLYINEGIDVANDYLNAIEDSINSQYGMQLATDEIMEVVQTPGSFSKVWQTFSAGFKDGTANFVDNIATIFNGNTTLTPTEYKTMYFQLFLTNFIQPLSEEQIAEITSTYQNGELEITEAQYNQLMTIENLTTLDMMFMTGEMSEDAYAEWTEIKSSAEYQEFLNYLNTGINQEVLNVSYNVGMATGYIAPTMLASAATSALGLPAGVGKFVAGLLNFSSSYGGNYKTNIRNGNMVVSSSIAAFFAAAGEAGTEYFLGKLPGISRTEDFVDLATDLSKYTSNIQLIGSHVLGSIKNIGSEIGEELLQDTLTKTINYVVLGEPIKITVDETLDTAIITAFTTLFLGAPTNAANLAGDLYNFNQSNISFDLGNGQTVSYSQSDISRFYDANTGVLKLDLIKADMESRTGLELGESGILEVKIGEPTTTTSSVSSQESSNIVNIIAEIDSKLGEGKGLELLTHYVETGDISEISAVGFRENLLDISFDNLKIELSTLMSNLATEGSTFSNNLAHRLVESQFKKISDFFFKYSTGTDTYFGADQNATRKHRYIEIINSDFLIENRDPFAKFILDNSNGKITSISEALNVVDTVINTKNMELDFANKYLIHYILKDFESIRQKYGSSNAVEFVLSFSQYADKPEYIKFKNKLVNMGLSPLESKQLLDGFNTTGTCSYATIANSIFSYYMDNQAQFQSDFGFSMFTEIDGVERLNTSEMLLDFYIFCNSNLGRKYLTEETKKNLGQEMFNISDNGELQINHLNFSNQTFLSGYVNGLKLDLINGYLEYKNTSIRMILEKNSSFEVENRNDYPSNFYRFSYNPNYTFSDYLNSLIKDALNNGKMVQLSVCKVPYHEFKFILNTDEQSEIITTNNWEEGGAHAVMVTGYSDDYVHVASWGKEYLIPWSDFYNNRFSITILNIENTNQ